jgi:glycosyltransferase involved in cell wall biosynthesis
MSVPLAQVIYQFSMGGSEMLACRLARGLLRQGTYAPRLYSVCGSGPLTEVLPEQGIPCLPFTKRGRLDIRLLVLLAQEFRRRRIRLVHTHHLGQLLYGGLAGRLAGARVIHTEHEFYTLNRRRSQRLLRVLAACSERVTTVAQPVERFLRDQVRIPPWKLVTIPNGVQLELFRSVAPVERSALGWNDTDLIIGCVARLQPEKGHAVLLEAFRQVRTRVPSARLLLVGDGDERSTLAGMAESWNFNGAIRFLGSRDDIPQLLSTCDIVALASFHEGQPMALLEAMAARRAVVATSVGGVPDLVHHGKTGLLVPPGDAPALAEALGRLLQDERLRSRLADEACGEVQERFSFARTLEQYEAVYTAALRA